MTPSLLLISNSTMHGGEYLAHCRDQLEQFLAAPQQVAFIPFALADHDGYEAAAKKVFESLGHSLASVHRQNDPRDALASKETEPPLSGADPR